MDFLPCNSFIIICFVTVLVPLLLLSIHGPTLAQIQCCYRFYSLSLSLLSFHCRYRSYLTIVAIAPILLFNVAIALLYP
jgi:hypothetical protein